MTKSIQKRKIVKIGGNKSMGVSLHKQIMNLWGWKPGDFIDLEFDDDQKAITIKKFIK
jgi:hypothetical protein